MVSLDPIELLDILGNENRRRILQLLSFRPFYFNEIAKRLDVGPKAVIDHLEMLERAGLIECYRDSSRRKYFRIANKTVLEVAVSPHSYGVRAYKSEGTSLGGPSKPVDLKALQDELNRTETKRTELRSQMEEIYARETELKRLAVEAIQASAKDQLEAEILVALLSGASSCQTLAERMAVPAIVIEDSLKKLEARSIVRRRGEQWSI